MWLAPELVNGKAGINSIKLAYRIDMQGYKKLPIGKASQNFVKTWQNTRAVYLNLKKKVTFPEFSNFARGRVRKFKKTFFIFIFFLK